MMEVIATALCYVRHGTINSTLVQVVPRTDRQAAHAARALTELLRPYAATYIPTVDLTSNGRSVTSCAIADDGIDLRNAFESLRKALDPVTNVEPCHQYYPETIIFGTRSFLDFFHTLAQAADVLDHLSPPNIDDDPWPQFVAS